MNQYRVRSNRDSVVFGNREIVNNESRNIFLFDLEDAPRLAIVPDEHIAAAQLVGIDALAGKGKALIFSFV